MKATIDSAGRLVIPKAVRDELALAAGTELELRVVDRRIEIEIPATPMRLVEHRHGVAAATDRDMPVLTTEMVRDALDHVRR